MKSKLATMYKKLYSYFGPQHWWPAGSPFEVMVGAILAQNTNWSNVEKAINNLKQKKVLDPRKLYALSEQRLSELIKPSGFYNIKTKRLRDFLNFIFKVYKGNLKKLPSLKTKILRQKLLSIKGIGHETADSILLYALDKPVFVVDAYTRRMLLRHKFIKEDYSYDEVQNFFMQNLKKDVKLFNEFHALLVKLGKEFCLKNKPRCNICPIK